MHNALLVRRLERFGYLGGDRPDLVFRYCSARDSIRQRLAFHVLEDKGRLTARFLQTIDGADVRVIEGGDDLRLTC